MEFRLTFEGKLFSTQGSPRNGQTFGPERRDYRHGVRRQFHSQLRELWEKTPHLKNGDEEGLDVRSLSLDSAPTWRARTALGLAQQHAMFGFNFVPLVTPEMHLLVGLDILFLRRDPPGSLFSGANAGDIDNRIKTLVDCLRLPKPGDDYASLTPKDDEKPFYCLLQDDTLVTKLAVTTDLLLQDTSDAPNDADARLVITVTLRPYRMSWSNLPFVG